MKIAIANDHAGLELKKAILEHFPNLDWLDLGTNTSESVDYPDYGAKLARAITENQAERGIVICGSGIGISIAANRFPAVRAALCTDVTMARLSRLHNNANVLALGGRLTGVTTAFDIVEAFIAGKYEGGRHERRVQKLSETC
ncbi:MAG: ribose 5-phosphate isomerase B [Alphaproteobacteria bacterium]|nr:ribose 5-phosphate isomerase B [Alphaproteobacteria bacterium]